MDTQQYDGSFAPEQPKRNAPPAWLAQLDVREQKEVDFARLYVAQYDHGSPGHLHLKIIAKLAIILDRHEGLEAQYVLTRILTEVGRE